jgi:two-component system, NarL family, response regulator DevR
MSGSGRDGSIRVFIMDDQQMVRQGLKDRFSREADIEVIGEAASAQAALAMVPVLRPDVAVLDVQLPDGDGVSVCREIRANVPSVACLMLTAYSGDDALIGAIMAGAAGYVRKDNFAGALAGAVRAVAEGGSALDSHAAAVAMALVREQLSQRRGLELSEPETRVLAMIGQGLTDPLIAQRLGVPEQTAKASVYSLLSKLGLVSTTMAGRLGG